MQSKFIRADDSLDHGVLRRLFRQRVCDGVITRLIDKWLHAGVMDKGNIFYPESGTLQGGSNFADIIK
jgi:hypothetical protein